MQTSSAAKPAIETSYSFGTGEKEYYYTLWRKTIVRSVPGTQVRGCYFSFRQNLAHDYDEAIAKAIAITGQTSWEKFDISDWRRRNSGNPDLSLSPEEVKFSFGKYLNKTVAEVEDEDFNYLLFLATKSDWEPTQTKHARVLNYIKAIYQPVAEKQEAERLAARAERDAQRADLPAFEGRVTITGTVVSTKCVESQFGSTVKMLVEHEDGWRIWTTIPSSIFEVYKGDVVQFKASIERSDRDPKFGFGKRPTNGSIIRKAAAPVEA